MPAAEPGDLDVDAVAGDLHAAVGQLPELDTSTVGPATETRLEELAEREAARTEAAEDEAQREANREAFAAAELGALEPGAPSAWVQDRPRRSGVAPRPARPSPRQPGQRPGCRRHRVRTEVLFASPRTQRYKLRYPAAKFRPDAFGRPGDC